MKLIGLTGPAGSGKNTVARFLCETQGFVQIAFADPMRDAVKAMFGLTDEDFSDREKKETIIPWIGCSPRELLVGIGDWARGTIDEEIMIFIASRRMQRVKADAVLSYIQGIVISDIRLDNEANWLRYQGCELWHIHRTTMAYSGLATNVRSHATERGVERQEGDRIIHNDSSIDQLLEHVGSIFSTEETA